MKNSNLIDFPYLRSRLKENQIQAILKSFLSTTPPIVEDIKQAVELRDATDLENKAHLLKGASSMVTAMELSSLCSKLEKLAGSGNWDTADELCTALVQSFEQIKHELSD
jgi:HPt (histidine-containing phosphotransfer) domain-containing protein